MTDDVCVMSGTDHPYLTSDTRFDGAVFVAQAVLIECSANPPQDLDALTLHGSYNNDSYRHKDTVYHTIEPIHRIMH